MLSALLAGVPALYKAYQGFEQLNKADELKRVDSTTPAFRELLGMGRQAAASSTLPGEGQQIDRIDAGLNTTASAAVRAGNSGSSVLGLLSGANQSRNRSLMSLATQSEIFRQQSQQRLGGLLGQQAQIQKADSDNFNRSKAALLESGNRNIYGALEDGASAGVYALSGGAGATNPGQVLPTTPGFDYNDTRYPSPYLYRGLPGGLNPYGRQRTSGFVG